MHFTKHQKKALRHIRKMVPFHDKDYQLIIIIYTMD